MPKTVLCKKSSIGKVLRNAELRKVAAGFPRLQKLGVRNIRVPGQNPKLAHLRSLETVYSWFTL